MFWLNFYKLLCKQLLKAFFLFVIASTVKVLWDNVKEDVFRLTDNFKDWCIDKVNNSSGIKESNDILLYYFRGILLTILQTLSRRLEYLAPKELTYEEYRAQVPMQSQYFAPTTVLEKAGNQGEPPSSPQTKEAIYVVNEGELMTPPHSPQIYANSPEDVTHAEQEEVLPYFAEFTPPRTTINKADTPPHSPQISANSSEDVTHAEQEEVLTFAGFTPPRTTMHTRYAGTPEVFKNYRNHIASYNFPDMT
ncbi:hypothetical protein [Rickettsiales endosymbiont of Stachyamoeba lipophora]|uniref:hypothetical protein n=1 Tax=Rickettsiales endosymbiont of Stachyamoeba lipophora TaxID=2486578 RepID=UPI000F648E81|nr:hypothetical protein [Rickettsiales endosymbiont of Stachyamoeba lipophora]AZL16212.1 hypothetical protein EF513_06685 [Rickettsiales endosymbiont of Stachyamoeba lipophora]